MCLFLARSTTSELTDDNLELGKLAVLVVCSSLQCSIHLPQFLDFILQLRNSQPCFFRELSFVSLLSLSCLIVLAAVPFLFAGYGPWSTCWSISLRESSWVLLAMIWSVTTKGSGLCINWRFLGDELTAIFRCESASFSSKMALVGRQSELVSTLPGFVPDIGVSMGSRNWASMMLRFCLLVCA